MIGWKLVNNIKLVENILTYCKYFIQLMTVTVNGCAFDPNLRIWNILNIIILLAFISSLWFIAPEFGKMGIGVS